MEENLAATTITFTREELSEFRKALQALPVHIHGIRTPETVQVDR